MKIDFKDFFKSTEAITIYLGVILTFTIGNFWLIPMVIVYSLLNLPKLWWWIKDRFR